MRLLYLHESTIQTYRIVERSKGNSPYWFKEGDHLDVRFIKLVKYFGQEYWIAKVLPVYMHEIEGFGGRVCLQKQDSVLSMFKFGIWCLLRRGSPQSPSIIIQPVELMGRRQNLRILFKGRAGPKSIVALAMGDPNPTTWALEKIACA